MAYTYKGTDTLINKFNIKDSLLLHAVERNKVTIRLCELYENNSIEKKNFDLEHLKNIHQYLFQDIYAWAGKLRTIDIEKIDALELIDAIAHPNAKATAQTQFCPSHRMEGLGEDITRFIKKNQYLQDMDRDHFVDKASFVLGELNYLHPFREGNGRTQREFMRQLAYQAGWELNFTGISKEEMIEASIAVGRMDYKPLQDILKESLRPLQIIKSKEYIDKIEDIKAAPDLPALDKRSAKSLIYNAYAKDLGITKDLDEKIIRAMVKDKYSKMAIQKTMENSVQFIGFSHIDKCIKAQKLVKQVCREPELKKLLDCQKLMR